MIRKLLYSFAIATLPLGASAIIASPDPVTITQPDGTTLTLVISGDEHHHIIRTADGVMVAQGADGFYRYTNLDANGRLAPVGSIARNLESRSLAEISEIATIDQASLLDLAQADRNAKMKAVGARKAAPRAKIGPFDPEPSDKLPGLCDKAFPSTGEQKAIVILVEYQDVRFEVENPKEYFSRMLNEEGFSDYGATGSARDYFVNNSHGLFKPQFDVYGPILLKEKRKYYGGNDYYYNSDEHPEMMAVEACEQLDPEVDFTEYDRDNDGSIDNVFIFYAGQGEHDGGGADAIWPHAAHLSSWIAQEYVYDGKILDAYGCTCERQTGFDRPAAIGTFVHEFSHVMGLPDLYSTEYNGAYTPGKYSCLDQGPYNNDGHTPPNFSAFERTALGWMEATEFGEDGWYVLDNLADSNRCFIIPSNNRNEYYLLENRQLTGNDTYIPGHGMLVWHIDYDHDTWEVNEVNNTPKLQRVDLIEADGTNYDKYRAGHPFPGSKEITSFGFNTSPASLKFRNGTETMIELCHIEENAETGRIGFSYTTDGSGGASVKTVDDESESFSIDGNTVTAYETVEIFTLSGTRVATLAAGKTHTLPAEGLYILKGTSGTKKLRIK